MSPTKPLTILEILRNGKKNRPASIPQPVLSTIFETPTPSMASLEPLANAVSISVDDPSRRELLWETREEFVIGEWKERCSESSKAHGAKARKTKRWFTALSLPTIILPLVLSGFSEYLSSHPTANSVLLLTTASLTGLSAFLNLGKKSQLHFNSEASYADLALSIQAELCKPKRARLACDVYLERTRSQLSALDKVALPV